LVLTETCRSSGTVPLDIGWSEIMAWALIGP
jgi:hypothetical protein